MDELPQEVQKRQSPTFDFNKVKNILIAGYYRGPAVHKDNSRTGMRSKALRGDPASWRKSILQKATETNLLQQTAKGYATTPHGYSLLKQMTICDDCENQQDPYGVMFRTGKRTGYYGVVPMCPNCDDPLSPTNVQKHTQNDDNLKEAVEMMDSHNVTCYLNGKSASQVRQDLGT